jgi:hypothetical protein
MVFCVYLEKGLLVKMGDQVVLSSHMNKIEEKKKLGRFEKMWERVKARFKHVKHVCISKEVDRFKVHM